MHELMDPSSAQLHHHHHHQQHQQEMSSHSLESMLQANCSGKPTNSSSQAAAAGDQRKPRPQPEQALKCPRCDSTNTKFCYYNNYSLSQPRYFCKSCRRYWTKGGTLRNVPVGGGCRKNKRSSSSSSNNSANSSATSTPTSSSSHFSNVSSLLTHLIPPSSYDSNDLALAFARLQKHHQLGFDHDQESPVAGQMFNTTNFLLHGNPAAAAGGTNTPTFLDALRNTNSSSSSFLDVGNNLQGLYYGGGGEGGVYNGNSGFADHDGEQQDEQQNHEMAAVMTHQYNTSGDHESVSGPATTQAVTVTTMKQEQFLASSCMNGRQEESGNKVLWGFPWQMNGSCDNISSSNGTVVDNAMRASTESGSWWSSSSSNGGNNGGGVLGGSATTNWHGLLNTSPLM